MNDSKSPFNKSNNNGQRDSQPPSASTANNKILSDVVAGRDNSQLMAAEQLGGNAGAAATDKLLGLHLQPTIAGAFAPPPGNSEALRHLTPTMRRTIVRNLLSKQRERTKRLARFVRRQRDQHDSDGEFAQNPPEKSFIGLLTDGIELSDEQVNRATEELVIMARMLDLLDEMLVLQDYTLGQMGTFSPG